MLGIACSTTQAIEAISLKEKLFNLLLTPLSSSITSDNTQAEAKVIAETLDPKSTVRVRNLNALGRLLVGYKNTISIPFINYVLVNEQWLQTLPPKAKEFVLARSMMYLLSNPYEYVTYKYLFPLLIYAGFRNLIQYTKDYKDSMPTDKKLVIHYLSEALTYLIPSYILRTIEHKMDAKAAIQFNCFDGAIAAITDSSNFSHRGSALDKLNSGISGVEAADLLTTLSGFYTDANLKSTDSPLLKSILRPITMDEISLLSPKLLLSPKYLIPGKFTDRQSSLFNFIKNLPLINLIFDYPKPYKRIRELNELRNKILKDKIQTEKTKR